MRKPKYAEEILKLVALMLGISFILVGLIVLFGKVEASENSMIQDPAIIGLIFISVGAVFTIVYIVTKIRISSKNKLQKELIANGITVMGRIEGVHMDRNVSFGHHHPYRVYYTYTYQGMIYHHESHLYWNEPACMKNDPIVVYVNNEGKSAIQI